MKAIIAKKMNERPEVMRNIEWVLRNADRVNSQDSLEKYHGTSNVRNAMYSIACKLGFTVESMFNLSIAVNNSYVSCYDEKHGNLLFAIDRENGEIDYLVY